MSLYGGMLRAAMFHVGHPIWRPGVGTDDY